MVSGCGDCGGTWASVTAAVPGWALLRWFPVVSGAAVVVVVLLRWFPVAVSAVVLGWVLLRVVVACAGLPTFQVSDFLASWFSNFPGFRLLGVLVSWYANFSAFRLVGMLANGVRSRGRSLVVMQGVLVGRWVQ